MYKVKIIERNEIKFGEIVSDNVVLSSDRDALDVMVDVQYYGSNCVIIRDHHVPASFFDLSSKLAGEILLKFTQYHTRLAIVGDFSKYPSKHLNRFINESNRGSQIFFSASVEDAIEKMIAILEM